MYAESLCRLRCGKAEGGANFCDKKLNQLTSSETTQKELKSMR